LSLQIKRVEQTENTLPYIIKSKPELRGRYRNHDLKEKNLARSVSKCYDYTIALRATESLVRYSFRFYITDFDGNFIRRTQKNDDYLMNTILD